MGCAVDRVVFVVLVVCHSLSRPALAHDVSLELEGGVMYDITWLSRAEPATSTTSGTISVEDTPDKTGDGVLTEQLPNLLLGDGQSKEETVVMKTIDNEQYKCVLPGMALGDENESAENEGSTELTPEYLLRPLQHQCTRLLMGYWNYELCHGNYLRQYHEEKLQDGRVKLDEYMLGEFDNDLDDKPTPRPPSAKDGDRIPVWPMHGREYPYYWEEMGGGSPCDVKNNEPRSVIIRYICDPEAYKYGALLRVDEVISCKYEALVSIPLLCQNPRYRLKEVPILPIKCYPLSDSSRRPKALLEQDLLSASFKASATKAMPTDQSGSLYDDGRGEQSGSRVNTKRPSNVKPLELDKGFVQSFLSGQMCLRGGSGWWLHEVCNGAVVRQVHLGQDGQRVEVVLGVWSMEAHREWFGRTGHRKMSKSQVVHLYKGGDVCDVTGTPRQCLVKYKCVKSAKPSQISLYLEEPTTCSYSLTVEGAFVCSLLPHLDDYGIFDLASYEGTNQQTNDQEEVGKKKGDDIKEAEKDKNENVGRTSDDVIERTKDKNDVVEAAKEEVDVGRAEGDNPRDNKKQNTGTSRIHDDL